MKFVVLISIAVLSLILQKGCCRSWEQPQPSRPKSVREWNSYKTGTVRIIGEFVLTEGQSTASESLAVEVIKISPLITCLAPSSEPPRKEVTLKLYSPLDKQTLCETTVGEGGGMLRCPNRASLPSISVNGINTKEYKVHPNIVRGQLGAISMSHAPGRITYWTLLFAI
jgi:hypothetical protein